MKHLELLRVSDSPLCTRGVLKEQGEPFLVTLENPWCFNQPSISCIPEGTYIVQTYDSDKHHNSYIVTNVYGRTYILFHSGNTEKDTAGCILPGLSFGELEGQPAVLHSAQAMKVLENRVGSEDFTLTIKRG